MNSPEVITTVREIRERVRSAKRSGTVGLVPTMGALHEGHLSLVRAASRDCETVVVSIFVNPTQFGPNEDFSRYPRTLEQDLEKLQREKVAVAFVPSVHEMYPAASTHTLVEVPGLSERLDGAHRPGHFRGVATVVSKLFNIVLPEKAYFGQKDAAQVAVLRAMVRDLNVPTELVVCPTQREPDGLAMSSRNQYLSPIERTQALVLSRALNAAGKMAAETRSAADLRRRMQQELATEGAARVEYAEVVDPDTLLPLEDVSRGALLAVAATIGRTRLIDNALIESEEVASCA
jgi:pantoate--beta-alanine ligase